MKFDTQIIDLVRKGLTTQDIVNATGKSRATIYRSVKAYNAMLAESGSSAEGQPPRITMKDDMDIKEVNSEWVLRRLIDISSGADGTAGNVQIVALKAILEMIRAKETAPTEMSLAEKLDWLKKMMTPDEFLSISEGWLADDRRKIYDHFALEFRTNNDATNEAPR